MVRLTGAGHIVSPRAQLFAIAVEVINKTICVITRPAQNMYAYLHRYALHIASRRSVRLVIQ